VRYSIVATAALIRSVETPLRLHALAISSGRMMVGKVSSTRWLISLALKKMSRLLTKSYAVRRSSPG
jgi:hypothetical protein